MKNEPRKPSAAPLRDGAGHLNARVAADLLARTQGDRVATAEDRAFFRGARSGDPLAEQLGESFVASAMGTDGADDEPAVAAEIEERGGPFVETTSETEVALGTDASNPSGSMREPFPLT